MTGPMEENPELKKLEATARGRQQFEFDGRVIYEWEQNLDEVHIYIPLPEHVTKHNLDIGIQPRLYPDVQVVLGHVLGQRDVDVDLVQILLPLVDHAPVELELLAAARRCFELLELGVLLHRACH